MSEIAKKGVVLFMAAIVCGACGNSARWNNPPSGVPQHPGGTPAVGRIVVVDDDEPIDTESNDGSPTSDSFSLNPYDDDAEM